MNCRVLIAFGLSVVLGVAWGVACWAGDRVPPAYGAFFNVGAPWLLLAFAMGMIAQQVPYAAIDGALVLGLAVVAYYVTYKLYHIVDPASDTRYFFPVGEAWLVVATPAGALFGAAGGGRRSSRQWVRVSSVMLLGGALFGEALYLFHQVYIDAASPYTVDRWPAGFVLCEALLGLLAPAVLLRLPRDRMLALAGIGCLALVGLGIETAVEAYTHMIFKS